MHVGSRGYVPPVRTSTAAGRQKVGNLNKDGKNKKVLNTKKHYIFSMDGPYNVEVAYTKPNHRIIICYIQCSLRSIMSLCLSPTHSPSPKG